MRAFLTELSARPPAGCKDPRTVLTFPIWKPHLRDYRIAACFRHPLAVARSLEVRNRMPLEAGLALWRAYNERLLAVTANEPDVDWFCFDEPAGAQARRVRGVCARAGLNVDAIDASQFNPHLKHHRDADPIADPALADLYARLQDRLAARPTDASAAKPVSPRARAARRRRATERAVLLQNVQIQDLNYRIGGAEHRARLAEEGRQAVAAQAEAARQAQAAEIAALQAALGRAGQELAALHATVVRLEADLARVASRTEEAWIFAARLRNIWPLRLRRWLGSLLARRPAHEGRM
jgi:hypothetical protein